jgi:hypothetical protein
MVHFRETPTVRRVALVVMRHGMVGRTRRRTDLHREVQPRQNPYVERLTATIQRDLLNAEEFNNITEARVVIANWNTESPPAPVLPLTHWIEYLNGACQPF